MTFSPGPKMQAMMARGARCAECPLAPFENGPVFSEIRPGMPICILAEAPGGDEVDQGRPLVGRTGDVLWDALSTEGFRRSETSQINTVNCRPPVIAGQPVSLDDYIARLPKGTLSPVDACQTRFRADVEEAKPHGFLILGEKALEATAHYLNVSYKPKEIQLGVPFIGSMAKTQGAPIVLPRDHIVYDGSKLETKLSLPPERTEMIALATYHPAFAMRAKEFLRPVRSFIARGARLIWDGKIKWKGCPILLLLELDEEEALQRVVEFHRLVMENKSRVWLTSDLETDGIEHEFLGIRCFGFHVDTDDKSLPEFAVVVPWMWRDGRRWWHRHESNVQALLRELYDECRLIFHNGGPFDTRVLINNDFFFDSARHFDLLRENGTPQAVIDMMPVPERKVWFDTRIAHRATRDTDLPHDLDFCATRYFDSPKWKHEADAKDSKGVKTDRALHLYCGMDCTVTGRLRPEMTKEIALFDTIPQFQKDAELDAMYREMSRMGLCIDEVFRGEASQKYHELVYKLRRGFQAVVEKITPGRGGINPGSWQQLGKWLYDELGLTPEMTSNGRPWSPGLPRSTRYDAIQLLEQNQLIQAEKTDPKMKLVRRAIDYLLRYKVSKKLLSSFVDGIPVRPWPGLSSTKAPAVDFSFMYRDEDEDEVPDESVLIQSLPERDALTILFATFMLTPPSGRLGSQPNVQNWPNVGYGGLETRKMIRAAPGHVLLASDYKQIEQRIYVVIAGDELLQRCYDEGLDPHTFNTATLLMKGKYSWEAALVEYHRIDALDKKAKKSVRNIGKTTQYAECVAEGSMVLTDYGLVPIEQVALHHKLWDGVEWVEHSGVVCTGTKQVIAHDGVEATPEHIVWLEDGTIAALVYAARHNRVLARAGAGRNPLRFLGNDYSRLARRQISARDLSLSVRSPSYSTVRQSSGAKNNTLSVVRPNNHQKQARPDRRLRTVRQKTYSLSLEQNRRMPHLQAAPSTTAEVAHATTARSKTPLYKSAKQELGRLRRTGYPLRFHFDRNCGAVGHGKSQYLGRAEAYDRSYRQQRTLCSRQHSASVQNCEWTKSAAVAHAGGLEVHTGGLAVHIQHRTNVHEQWVDPRTDPRKGAANYSDERTALQKTARVVRVYDIVDAGPRHRFTVGGRLVGNSYGVEEDKIGDFFLTARDKSTGALQFPDMTAEKAEYLHNKWHELHPETRRWQAAITKELAMKKYIDTLFLHRKRAFPDGPSKKNAPGNHRVQGCHPIDELILTDRGYITFEQALLLEPEKPAETNVVPSAPTEPPGGPLLAWTGTAWGKARILAMGEDERVELHLDNGSVIRCDTRERVKTLVGQTWEWRHLVELKPTDVIATCTSRPINIGSSWPGWNKEDAFWLGYVHGGAWSESPMKDVRRDRYRRAAVIGGLRDATLLAFDVKRNLGRAVVPYGDPPDSRFIRLRQRAEKWLTDHARALAGLVFYDFELDSWSTKDECAPELASHVRFTVLASKLDRTFGRKGWDEWRDIEETQRRLLWKELPLRKAYLEGYLESLAEPTQLVLRLAETVGMIEETVVGEYACARIVEIVRTGKREKMYTLSVDHDDHAYVCSSLISKNSAGDLVNDAAQRVVEAIPFRKWSRWSGLVNQIHDQLVVQAPEGRAEEAKAIMTKVMPASMKGMDFPIDEVQIGYTLGDV